jgi:quercetin dioxygenase-like cupin family protein
MEVISDGDIESSEVLDGVQLAQLIVGDQMNIQHFEIQPGVYVDNHQHEQEQAGYLFSGELVWVVEGEEFVTEAGDSYIIPGNDVHSAENTGDEPAVGIEVFSPPRPNPPWAE